jgi:hypothetical protein
MIYCKLVNCSIIRGRRGHDHMVVGFTTAVQSVPITTTVVRMMTLQCHLKKCAHSFTQLLYYNL